MLLNKHRHVGESHEESHLPFHWEVEPSAGCSHIMLLPSFLFPLSKLSPQFLSPSCSLFNIVLYIFSSPMFPFPILSKIFLALCNIVTYSILKVKNSTLLLSFLSRELHILNSWFLQHPHMNKQINPEV